MSRKPICIQLAEARAKRGFPPSVAATRAGMSVDQITALEEGRGLWTEAVRLAQALGKSLSVVGFVPTKNTTEAFKRAEPLLDYRTAANCYRVCCSPMNIEADVKLSSMDVFLSGYSTAAHLELK